MPGEDPQFLTENTEEQNIIYRIIALDAHAEPNIKFDACLKTIQKNHLKQKEQNIITKMNGMSLDEMDSLQSLQEERNKIRELLRQLQKPARQESKKPNK